MNKITVYGIPNCDTTKKALNWFRKNKIDVVFHDFRQQGVSKDKLHNWSHQAGMNVVLNKRSTTWKNLDEKQQAQAENEEAAIRLLLDHNTLIKRPVIESGKELLIGFDEKKLSDIFKK